MNCKYFYNLSLSLDIHNLLLTHLFKVALELIEHLRTMGETNALLQRNIVRPIHC